MLHMTLLNTFSPADGLHARSSWLHVQWVPSLITSLHATCCSTPPWPRPCRTSISRMSSKEKICLHEREKHQNPALPSSPVVDEEEEGQTGQVQSQSQGKASSSSSSEEESESESDTESGERTLQFTVLFASTHKDGEGYASFEYFVTNITHCPQNVLSPDEGLVFESLAL